MKFFIVIITFSIFIFSCNEKTVKKEIPPVESNEPSKKELSVEQINEMMKGAESPALSYEGAVTPFSSKEYFFDCDSGQTIQISMNTLSEKLVMNVFRDNSKLIKGNAEKKIKTKTFVSVSDSSYYSEKCKRNTQFKALIKIKESIKDSSVMAKYSLDVTLK